MVDMVLYCDLEDGEDKTTRRLIRTKPSKYYEAGDRTGRLPETLDLDFRRFLDAYSAAVAPPKIAGRRQDAGGEVNSQQEKRP